MSEPAQDQPADSAAAVKSRGQETNPGEIPNDAPTGAKPLNPDEQLALFEAQLKEDDWGHQPC